MAELFNRADYEFSASPRIRLRPKAGFGGQERGEVKKALHRQSILPRQFLERHLRSRADVLDHFGRRQRP